MAFVGTENGWSTTRQRQSDGSLYNPKFASTGGSANIVGGTSIGSVAFTGDSTYNDIANSLARAKADYDANLNAQRQQATQDYDWNKKDLDRQSGVDQYNMVNDFAGRGVLNSGLYAKEEDNRTAAVARQQQAMAMALQNRLNGFNQDASNFASSQADALNRAKQDAIARQASKIGVLQ